MKNQGKVIVAVAVAFFDVTVSGYVCVRGRGEGGDVAKIVCWFHDEVSSSAVTTPRTANVITRVL